MTFILGAQLAVKLNLRPAQCRTLNRILLRNFHTVHKHGRFAVKRHLHSCISSSCCHKSWPTRTDPSTASCCLLLPECLDLLQRTAKHSLAGLDCDDAGTGDGETSRHLCQTLTGNIYVTQITLQLSERT
ncbi:hypothetical protein NP493_46g05013 [Ridgeia piscesae]|uniref:Uncharacterized protein n=1 Tax=Ridgeia piscesae TaxID=27915 RepID=A0AAD9PBG9_RIDPI|nr:hypothetical protein NP493_46g05013 [Ridgeia piscesae]